MLSCYGFTIIIDLWNILKFRKAREKNFFHVIRDLCKHFPQSLRISGNHSCRNSHKKILPKSIQVICENHLWNDYRKKKSFQIFENHQKLFLKKYSWNLSTESWRMIKNHSGRYFQKKKILENHTGILTKNRCEILGVFFRILLFSVHQIRPEPIACPSNSYFVLKRLSRLTSLLIAYILSYMLYYNSRI